MKHIVYIITLFYSVSFWGQDITFVSEFELLEVHDGIFVNWQIDSGYTCQGVDILRSDDGIDFEEIGHISGVCGSLSKPVSYSFLDEAPVANSCNYYRLKLNGYGFTEILNIYYLEVPDKGVLTYPNPSRNEIVTVKFNNPNQEEMTVQLIDLNGSIFLERVVSSAGFQLDPSNLNAGVYQIRIFGANAETLTTDKLIVY